MPRTAPAKPERANCVACHRELEDPTSVAIGLGPDCRDTYKNNARIQDLALRYQNQRARKAAPNG